MNHQDPRPRQRDSLADANPPDEKRRNGTGGERATTVIAIAQKTGFAELSARSAFAGTALPQSQRLARNNSRIAVIRHLRLLSPILAFFPSRLIVSYLARVRFANNPVKRHHQILINQNQGFLLWQSESPTFQMSTNRY
jgi:hypothetical protein